MATFLLTWELGAGSGHLVRLCPILDLSQRGHKVFAALKDVGRAKTVLSDGLTGLFQTPSYVQKVASEFSPPLSFAHILHNVGFDDISRLSQVCAAWSEIYERVRPDVVVFDHSPAALLAARGLPFRRVLIGSGFFCPPDRTPLPSLRPWIQADPQRLLHDERQLLDRMNAVLRSFKRPSLERVTQLYAEVEENFLTTFRELDHYPDRPPATYWGAWTKTSGKPPQWPQVEGKRIFAYLKPSTGLAQLLQILAESRQPTIVSCDGIGAETQNRFAAPNIRFENERVDLEAVGRDCDFGVLNGNHGTTIALLLCGKPSFHVPITLEQAMLADAVRRTGAGLAASGARPAEVAQRFERMLCESEHTSGARAFQARYKDFDLQKMQRSMNGRIERLAAK
jgi:UDP:flavonoid glycosyltransferase YjiC (YdhE family)